MKTYMAGAPGLTSREKRWQALTRGRLLSYWNISQEEFNVPYAFALIKKRHMSGNKERKVDLFLDSGAYSAWTQGKPIDIQEYIRFIKENLDILDVYANLDGIPLRGSKKEEDEEGGIHHFLEAHGKDSAELTLKNQRIMEKAGLHPLPCFHFGEPFEYLQYYVDNYDYLALGVVGNSGKKLIPWLNKCFSQYICDKDGMPKVKVHGFAVTSLKVMLMYPWYSVDSTSWVLTGRMGSIFIPQFRNGVWNYNEQSWKIAVSNRSPNLRDVKKDSHVFHLSTEKRKIFDRYIAEKGFVLGKSDFKVVDASYTPQENERWLKRDPKLGKHKRELEIILEPGLSNTYQLRDEINIIYFLDLEENCPKWPWPFKTKEVQNGFF